jgi:hypothetical protein
MNAEQTTYPKARAYPRAQVCARASSTFWFALALVGQAAALRMIDAGTAIHFQHYQPLARLMNESPILLIALGAQTAFVAIGLARRGAPIRAWLAAHFKIWQIVLIALAISAPAAALSAQISFYIGELFFAAFIQIVNLGNLVLLAWSAPENLLASFKQRVDELLGDPIRGARLDRVAFIGALWVTLITALLAALVYQAHPHIPDEVAYVYHARYLASGALTGTPAPVPEAFGLYLIPFNSPEWYSPFPPGWPMMLALGVRAGAPWLVNPLFAGMNVLLVYLLMQELADRRVARLALILVGCSPWFIFMGMNLMSHTFALACFLVALIGILWARRTGQARWGWLAGGAVGAMVLIRPLDGVIVAVLLGVWAIGIGGARLKISALAGFGIGTLLVSAVMFPYNWRVTGDPLVLPLELYYEQYFGHNSNALGFGPERGLNWAIDAFPGHSPFEALLNNLLNLFSVNVELFGWSIGSLIFAIILVFAGKIEKRDWLALILMIAIVGVYSLYWFNGGPDFGARYWYLILIPLLLLTIRGIQFAGTILPDTRLLFALGALCALTLINYMPWRATDKYYHYLNMSPDILTLARANNFGTSIVLIRGASHPDYASAWIYNALDWRGDAPVYAWARDEQMCRQVIQAYADRPLWLVEGPSIAKGGYRVAVGNVLAIDFECGK